LSVSVRGFALATSTVNGRFLNGLELNAANPSLLSISDFGYIAVAFNHANSCLIKVLDQNLMWVTEKTIQGEISCWKYILWVDGIEYLVAAMRDRSVIAIKLPFLEELCLDIRAPTDITGIDFVAAPSYIIFGDAKGHLFCVKPGILAT
jgi:hypothetical protein